MWSSGPAWRPVVNVTRLIATLLAFFAAVGLAAHALDELHGRPLRTRIPSGVLVAVVAGGLAGAVAIGIVGVLEVGPVLVPFLVLGPFLVVGYNFELFGGVIHNDAGFAASWGAFPVVVAYVAQTGRVSICPAPGSGRCLRAVRGPTGAQHPGPDGPAAGHRSVRHDHHG